LIIFSSLSVLAEDSVNKAEEERKKRQFPTIRQEDFKPYMLGHIHEGCPSNSTCSKTTGAKRKRWIDVIKASPSDQKKTARGLERFRKQYGLPIGFWIHTEKVEKGEPEHNLIIWDSHCSNHQSKDPKQRIFMGEVMVKSMSELEKITVPEHQLFINKTWTIEKSGKINSYYHPRAEFPIMVDSRGIYITREDEGKYYGIQISSKGSLSVVPINNPKSFPREVSCPPALDAVFKTNLKMSNLYMGHYCKALWNNTTKEYQTFVFSWSCN